MSETTQTRIISSAGFDLTPPTKEQRTPLEAALTDEERDVLLHHGTEAPFCGGLLGQKDDGVYCCRLCGLPLFLHRTKFESGTGWPSFYAPFAEDHVREVRDTSYGMVRIETLCARCGSHQGHVFPDGPPPHRSALLHQLDLAAVREDRRSAARPAAPGGQAAGRAPRLKAAVTAAGAPSARRDLLAVPAPARRRPCRR